MRKIALLFGTMGVVGIIVGILMSVFIDISNVWFLIPIAMNGVWIGSVRAHGRGNWGGRDPVRHVCQDPCTGRSVGGAP